MIGATRSVYRTLTGLDVEGRPASSSATCAYQAQLCWEAGHDVDESTAARLWVMEVVTPIEIWRTPR